GAPKGYLGVLVRRVRKIDRQPHELAGKEKTGGRSEARARRTGERGMTGGAYRTRSRAPKSERTFLWVGTYRGWGGLPGRLRGLEQIQKSLAEQFRGGVVRRDHQDGVVAGNGSHHLRPLFAIERHRHGVGMSRS